MKSEGLSNIFKSVLIDEPNPTWLFLAGAAFVIGEARTSVCFLNAALKFFVGLSKEEVEAIGFVDFFFWPEVVVVEI